MPRISPGDRLKPMLVRACSHFCSLRHGTVSPCTSSNGAAALRTAGSAALWVESIAQTVGNVVQRKQSDREKRGRKDQRPPRGLHIVGALLDEHAPARIGFLHAQAK